LAFAEDKQAKIFEAFSQADGFDGQKIRRVPAWD